MVHVCKCVYALACMNECVCVCVLSFVTEQAPSNAGRKDRGGQGKLSSERGHSKTYLTPGHSKKREHIMANNLGSDEEDPELQV